jgi:hypothetical protein
MKGNPFKNPDKEHIRRLQARVAELQAKLNKVIVAHPADSSLLQDCPDGTLVLIQRKLPKETDDE